MFFVDYKMGLSAKGNHKLRGRRPLACGYYSLCGYAAGQYQLMPLEVEERLSYLRSLRRELFTAMWKL